MIIPEILCNFSLWEHSGNRLNFVIEHYKFNAFIAMFLIYKQIFLNSYIELTLFTQK